MVSITSKMMDTTLASIFTGVYDDHAESLTLIVGAISRDPTRIPRSHHLASRACEWGTGLAKSLTSPAS
ncbi:MAG: hypothetical protein VB142_09420 [Burkholderia sp.]